MATLATELWTGTSGAWPAQWTTTGTTALNANRGAMTTTAAAYSASVTANLTGMTATRDIDVVVDITFSNVDEQYWYLFIRATSPSAGATPSDGYSVTIFPGNGANSMGVSVWSAGNETQLSGDLAAGAWVANTARRVRFRALGNTIAVRVWDPAVAEPATWLYTTTNAVQSAATGKVSLIGAVGGPAAARSAYFDNLAVTSDGTTTSAPGSTTASASGSGTLTASLAGGSSGTTLPRQTSGVLLRTTAAGTGIYKHTVTTSDVANSNATVYVPAGKHGATTAKMVFAAHGLGDTAGTFMEQASITLPLLDLLADKGYVVIAPDYGATFGNDDAMGRISRAYAYMTAKWTTAGTVLFGFSMGGGISVVAYHRQIIPNVRGIQLVAPFVDYLALDPSTYPSEANSAYSAFGATTTAQFTSATAGYDPVRQPASAYTGVRMRAQTSSDAEDGYPMRTGTTKLMTLITPVAAQATHVYVTGGHGQPAEFVQPDQMVAFYETAISTVAVVTAVGLAGTGTLTATSKATSRAIANVSLSGAGTLTATLNAAAPRGFIFGAATGSGALAATVAAGPLAPTHTRGLATLFGDTGTGRATLDY